jgi:hypothetical protein
MTDKEVNDFLIKINREEDSVILFEKNTDISKIEIREDFIKYTNEERIFEYLKEEVGLIKKTSGSYDNYVVYGLTKKGIDIIRKGGWLNHIEIEKQKIKRKEEKERFDLRISKLQAKTGWLPYIISVIGIGISIWALAESKSNTPTNKHEQPLIKEHKQLPSKDYPTKDSLSEKGKRIDSLNLDNQ